LFVDLWVVDTLSQGLRLVRDIADYQGVIAPGRFFSGFSFDIISRGTPDTELCRVSPDTELCRVSPYHVPGGDL